MMTGQGGGRVLYECAECGFKGVSEPREKTRGEEENETGKFMGEGDGMTK